MSQHRQQEQFHSENTPRRLGGAYQSSHPQPLGIHCASFHRAISLASISNLLRQVPPDFNTVCKRIVRDRHTLTVHA